MAVMCDPNYIRITQTPTNFLILLPEKEDVKKKTDKETAIDVQKKGIVLCFLSQIMFTMFVRGRIWGNVNKLE